MNGQKSLILGDESNDSHK